VLFFGKRISHLISYLTIVKLTLRVAANTAITLMVSGHYIASHCANFVFCFNTYLSASADASEMKKPQPSLEGASEPAPKMQKTATRAVCELRFLRAGGVTGKSLA
jgi:hypothetical protein